MTLLRSRLNESALLRVGVNSVWLAAGRILSQVLLFAFTVLLARGLGQSGLGQYAFIMAVLFLGNVITTLGLDAVIIRELASDQSPQGEARDRLISNVLTIQLAISAVVISCVWAFAGLLPNQTADTIPAFKLASLALIPLAFTTIFSAILRARERMDLWFLVNLTTAAFLLLGGYFVIRNGGQLSAIMLVVIGSQAAGALAGAVLCYAAGPDFQWHWRRPAAANLRRLFPMGVTLGMLMILAIGYQRMGTILLSLMTDDAVTGWYAAALRITEALKILPAAFIGALFPLLARMNYRSSNPDVPLPATAVGPTLEGSTLRATYAGLLAAAIVASALVTLVSRPLITTIYGPEYLPSVPALRVLVWTLPLATVTMRASFDLVSRGRDRAALLALGTGLVVTIPLTILLIRQWGLLGACWGMVAGEAVHLLALIAIGRQPSSFTFST